MKLCYPVWKISNNWGKKEVKVLKIGRIEIVSQCDFERDKKSGAKCAAALGCGTPH